MILFLCSFGVSLGRYCQESVVKSWMFGENIKGGGGRIGGLSMKGGFKASAHYESEDSSY